MIKILITLSILTSCAIFKKGEDDVTLSDMKVSDTKLKDYVDHLKHFYTDYKKLKKEEIFSASNTSKAYINKVLNSLIRKNSIFFDKEDDAQLTIIKSKIPFHFSVPGRKIVISSGLFLKYIKNESLLYCVLMFELIRSEKNIYKKVLTVPTGARGTKEILSLLRLNIKSKVDVHKWAINLLKKNNIDSDTYLSWLQIQNRNSIDFSSQLGDINIISREEALFKDFIIKNSRNEKREYKRSSKSFYRLLRELRGNI